MNNAILKSTRFAQRVVCGSSRFSILSVLLVGLLLCLPAQRAVALTFDFDWGEETISGSLNTSITLGAAWRMEERSKDFVGKASYNNTICGRGPDGRTYYQSCQGLFKDQTFPAEHLVAQPGQFTSNADDGNWNYDKHDITQAPLKIVQDLTLGYKDFTLFVRGLAFHDFVNYNFREYHPNRITSKNLAWVGNVSTPGDELLPVGIGLPIGLPLGLSGLFPGATFLSARSDSLPCPPERNPTGGPCGIVYGPGGVVRNKRTDKETLRQIGQDLQLLDASITGFAPLPGDRELTIKLGRQSLNWGESTVLFFDSLNHINPANANNLFRVGATLEDAFMPVGMLSLATGLTDNLTLGGYYQYEWDPLEAPAPGSFLSPIDIGTNNAVDYLTLGFGSTAEDPERIARLLDNPLSALTNTTGAIVRMRDKEPEDGGQYGLSLKYYADWLNDGTELAFYYANYHSRVPFVSFYSTPEACSKNATDIASFVLACPDGPGVHSLTDPNNPAAATSDYSQFDKLRAQLEYPEDIQMWGFSFNTVFGELAVQGEIAYRPDAPLQVDAEDLAMMGYGPILTNCHLPDAGCGGSTIGVGTQADGSFGTYNSSDFVVDANGTPGSFTDTFDLGAAHAPGIGRAMPSFIAPYRGYRLGTNPANTYIRGWENFDTYQFNLGGTYAAGATDLLSKLVNADQVIMLFELGATWVPDIPALDVLQLEAPGTFLHASAGADGSGADRSKQACSSNVACTYGPDGLRFNPHQEDLDLYPDEWSTGLAVVAAIKYESVLPGISLLPLILYKQDLHGTSPGLASNFVDGRKIIDASVEIRYKSAWSFTPGYTAFAGGGKANLLRDRDQFRMFVKYQF